MASTRLLRVVVCSINISAALSWLRSRSTKDLASARTFSKVQFIPEEEQVTIIRNENRNPIRKGVRAPIYNWMIHLTKVRLTPKSNPLNVLCVIKTFLNYYLCKCIVCIVNVGVMYCLVFFLSSKWLHVFYVQYSDLRCSDTRPVNRN